MFGATIRAIPELQTQTQTKCVIEVWFERQENGKRGSIPDMEGSQGERV